MDLAAYLDAVVDESTFMAFVRALAEDRRASVEADNARPASPHGPGAGGCGGAPKATPSESSWENQTIEHFLEGAVSWAEDTEFGRSQGLSASNPWKRFAVFLYCGKIYE